MGKGILTTDLRAVTGSENIVNVNNINFNASAGPSGYGIRKSDGVIEKKSSGADWNPIHGYVERGDPAAHDFTQADLTMDNSFYDLDLSAIVPAGATLVSLRLIISDNTPGANIVFRKNGLSNPIASRGAYVQVNGVVVEQQIDVPCDASRLIEYRANEAFNTINITVLGWWI